MKMTSSATISTPMTSPPICPPESVPCDPRLSTEGGGMVGGGVVIAATELVLVAVVVVVMATAQPGSSRLSSRVGQDASMG